MADGLPFVGAVIQNVGCREAFGARDVRLMLRTHQGASFVAWLAHGVRLAERVLQQVIGLTDQRERAHSPSGPSFERFARDLGERFDRVGEGGGACRCRSVSKK